MYMYGITNNLKMQSNLTRNQSTGLFLPFDSVVTSYTPAFRTLRGVHIPIHYSTCYLLFGGYILMNFSITVWGV